MKGCYRLIVVSPELLINDSRFEDLWGKKKFTDNIINLVLDEAHVIKEWGRTFQSDYLRIGLIQYLLPRMIPIHLGSAMIGPQMVPELQCRCLISYLDACSPATLTVLTASCRWCLQLSQCAVYVSCMCQGLVYFFYLSLVRLSREIDKQQRMKHTVLRHRANTHKPPQQLLPVARENKQKLEFRSTTTNISDVVQSEHQKTLKSQIQHCILLFSLVDG